MRLQQYLEKRSSKSPTKPFKGTAGRLERLVQRVEAATKIVVEFRNKEAEKTSEVLSQRGRSTSASKKDIWPVELSKETTRVQDCVFPQSNGLQPQPNSSAQGSQISLETSHYNKMRRFEDVAGKQQKSHKISSMQQTLKRFEERLGAARNTLSSRLKPHFSLSEQHQSNTDRLLQKTHRTPAKNLIVGLNKQHKQEKVQEAVPRYYTSELVRALNEKYSIALEHVKQSIISLTYFSTFLPPGPQKTLTLNRRNKITKTIVFDLDDTLVHFSESGHAHYDVKLSMIVQTGYRVKAYINIRPYALCLLKKMHNIFEIIVMSAADPNYVKEVVSFLDPQSNLIDHTVYAESCLGHPNGIIKDLRVLGRDLSQVVIVDNTPFCYGLQPLNAIPILPYYGDNSDNSLRKLQDYLFEISEVDDVRRLNHQTFHLDAYPRFTQPQQLIASLYM